MGVARQDVRPNGIRQVASVERLLTHPADLAVPCDIAGGFHCGRNPGEEQTVAAAFRTLREIDGGAIPGGQIPTAVERHNEGELEAIPVGLEKLLTDFKVFGIAILNPFKTGRRRWPTAHQSRAPAP